MAIQVKSHIRAGVKVKSYTRGGNKKANKLAKGTFLKNLGYRGLSGVQKTDDLLRYGRDKLKHGPTGGYNTPEYEKNKIHRIINRPANGKFRK